MASKRTNIHTVPNPNGEGWVNKVNGESVSRHQRKDTAIDRGREIARGMQGEHSIHRRDGTIGQKNSYSKDPNPPKDKNR